VYLLFTKRRSWPRPLFSGTTKPVLFKKRPTDHEFTTRPTVLCRVVSTWMGDCLWTCKPSLYVTSHLGQLSLPSLRVVFSPVLCQVAWQHCVTVIPIWQVTPRRPIAVRWSFIKNSSLVDNLAYSALRSELSAQ